MPACERLLETYIFVCFIEILYEDFCLHAGVVVVVSPAEKEYTCDKFFEVLKLDNRLSALGLRSRSFFISSIVDGFKC